MKNCPECGAPSPVHDTRDVPYTYKGQETIIPAVVGHYCVACGEVTLDHDAENLYMEFIGAFHRKVNAELVDPAFITKVRTKLRLDKKQASAIFGGGPNAFVRYESGKAKPPIALVKLLTVLNNHPELLAEVR